MPYYLGTKMFNFIKEKLQKIYHSVTQQFSAIFYKSSIDQQTIDDLYKLLITADVGVATSNNIIQIIQSAYAQGTAQTGKDLQLIVAQQLRAILTQNKPLPSAQVYLLVGINGSGKTTLSGKLSYLLHKQGKAVMLAAADTFRAAATEQLHQWAEKSQAQIITSKPGQNDPSAVVFDACMQFEKGNRDVLIIDTAGRLQNKEYLMKELTKIKNTIRKLLPNHTIVTLLTVDAMLGQNSFSQAKIFHDATTIDGIVLTKMDGTAKGGIVFSIIQQLGIPVAYLAWGEQIEDITLFKPDEYIHNLLGDSVFSNVSKKI